MTGYSLAQASGGAIGRWLEAMGARPSCSIASADATLLLQAVEPLPSSIKVLEIPKAEALCYAAALAG
eukprot:1142831-Pelagomonas_calceolata.AAC.3